MRESTYTKLLMQQLVEDGAIVVPMVMGEMVSGWPDRLVYHRLWHGLIEMKSPKREVTHQQHINMKRLWARRPGCVWVVREPGIIEDPLVWPERAELARFASGTEMIAEILRLMETL